MLINLKKIKNLLNITTETSLNDTKIKVKAYSYN